MSLTSTGWWLGGSIYRTSQSLSSISHKVIITGYTSLTNSCRTMTLYTMIIYCDYTIINMVMNPSLKSYIFTNTTLYGIITG